MCVPVSCVHLCAAARRGQQRTWDALELELQVFGCELLTRMVGTELSVGRIARTLIFWPCSSVDLPYRPIMLVFWKLKILEHFGL